MKFQIKKILSGTFALVLAAVLLSGAFEVVNMIGGPSVAYEVLGSDGGYVPPSGSDGGGSSSSSSSSANYSSGSSSKSKVTKTAVKKKYNTMVVKGKTANLSAASLASHSIKIGRKKALSLKKAKGAVTFKKVKGIKKIKVDKRTGNITVRKGLKRGTYKIKVKIHAAGSYRYKPRSRTRTVVIKVDGVENTLSASGRSIEIRQNNLNSANVVIKRADALNVSSPVGAVTYSKVSGNDGISINSNTGDITVRKGTAEGEYQLQVKVTAAGNSVYYSKSITTTITVSVKAAETPEPDDVQAASNEAAVDSSDTTAAPAPEESPGASEPVGTDESGAAENQEP